MVHRVRRLFSFPDPVNETSARLVAAGVVVQAVVFLVVREWWLLVPLVYGFAARVLTGPDAQPARPARHPGVTPAAARRAPVRARPAEALRAGHRAGLHGGAAIAWALGAPVVSFVLIGFLVVAATLESVFAVCLGCIAYRFIWECDDCNDISERLRQALAAQQRWRPGHELISGTNGASVRSATIPATPRPSRRRRRRAGAGGAPPAPTRSSARRAVPRPQRGDREQRPPHATDRVRDLVAGVQVAERRRGGTRRGAARRAACGSARPPSRRRRRRR